MRKNIIFSLFTWGIGISVFFMIYRLGVYGVDQAQIPIKTLLDYIQSYDGYSSFVVLAESLGAAFEYISNSFVNFADGVDWNDIKTLGEYFFGLPLYCVFMFLATISELLTFLIETIKWIHGLISLII